MEVCVRKDLGRYQGLIKDVELADYKVRILTWRHGGHHARAGGEPRPTAPASAGSPSACRPTSSMRASRR